jgi:hypothetical protein
MRSRDHIDKATLGPGALRAIYQAFDDAWAEIAIDYADDAHAEAARTELALALLSVASDDSRDSRALKRHALQLMATQKPRAAISK